MVIEHPRLIAWTEGMCGVMYHTVEYIPTVWVLSPFVGWLSKCLHSRIHPRTRWEACNGRPTWVLSRRTSEFSTCQMAVLSTALTGPTQKGCCDIPGLQITAGVYYSFFSSLSSSSSALILISIALAMAASSSSSSSISGPPSMSTSWPADIASAC